MIGLAIANKQWALIALGPLLLALPPGRRAIALGGALATTAAVLAPLLLGSGGGFASGTRAVATPGSAIFQPWQVFWFFGRHGALVHGSFGAAKPGYRIGPEWAGHDLPSPGPALRSGPRGRPLGLRFRGARLSLQRALLALALILLARCLLDTWDALYYPLPFLLALLAWESGRPIGQARRC